jgi:transcription antitermination factor NusG
VNTDVLAEGKRWYVVHTLPHRESQVRMRLGAQGFRSFLPRHCKTVRHARKLLSVNAPFFPRYLFVALNLDRDRWRSVNGTFGVASLVMGKAYPLCVPPGVVENLIAACREDGQLRFADQLEIGQSVRVLTGPVASLSGEFSRVDTGRRVQVLLAFWGGTVPVQRFAFFRERSSPSPRR